MFQQLCRFSPEAAPWVFRLPCRLLAGKAAWACEAIRSRRGLPCPRRRRGSSGANGASRFDARYGYANAGALKQGGAARVFVPGRA